MCLYSMGIMIVHLHYVYVKTIICRISLLDIFNSQIQISVSASQINYWCSIELSSFFVPTCKAFNDE